MGFIEGFVRDSGGRVAELAIGRDARLVFPMRPRASGVESMNDLPREAVSAPVPNEPVDLSRTDADTAELSLDDVFLHASHLVDGGAHDDARRLYVSARWDGSLEPRLEGTGKRQSARSGVDADFPHRRNGDEYVIRRIVDRLACPHSKTRFAGSKPQPCVLMQQQASSSFTSPDPLGRRLPLRKIAAHRVGAQHRSRPR